MNMNILAEFWNQGYTHFKINTKIIHIEIIQSDREAPLPYHSDVIFLSYSCRNEPP